MAQEQAQKTAKAPALNLTPALLAGMSNRHIEDLVNLHSEFLNKLQETSRQWFDRMRSGADLASELASKLTTARSLPDAMTACREWAGRRFAIMAQERKHLFSAAASIHAANTGTRCVPRRLGKAFANPRVGPRAEAQRYAKDLKIGPLVFLCPATGREIESGIDTDSLTFRRIAHLAVRLRCRGCGRAHELKAAEGRLASYRMPGCVGDLCGNPEPAPAHAASEQNNAGRRAAGATPSDIRKNPDAAADTDTIH